MVYTLHHYINNNTVISSGFPAVMSSGSPAVMSSGSSAVMSSGFSAVMSSVVETSVKYKFKL